MPPTNKDPVCKMEVDPKNAEAKAKHDGQTYYFCCPECKEKFEKDPDRYVGSEKMAHQ
jgi:P-type Cu+ transporter